VRYSQLFRFRHSLDGDLPKVSVGDFWEVGLVFALVVCPHVLSLEKVGVKLD